MPTYDPNNREPRDPSSIDPSNNNTRIYAALAIVVLVLAGLLFFSGGNELGNPTTATSTEQTVPNTPPPVRTE